MKKYILLLAATLTFTLSVKAELVNDAITVKTDTVKRKVRPLIFPVPPPQVSRLFYIQRDPTPNTIIYELNLKSNGQPNEEEPVHPYWIRYKEHGQREELSYIQRKFAYGLNQTNLGNGKWDIRFVAYKKLALTLMKGNDGKYHIFALFGQKQAILNRIFVHIEGGSFWIPNIVYVELMGTDPATGQEVSFRFKP